MAAMCRESPLSPGLKPNLSKYVPLFIYSFSQQIFIGLGCILDAGGTKLRLFGPCHLKTYSVVRNNFCPKNNIMNTSRPITEIQLWLTFCQVQLS